jgi:hypothetical protein
MAINELIASGGTPVTIDNPIKNALAISQLRGNDLQSTEAERAIRNRNVVNALAKKYTDSQGKTDLEAMRKELAGQGDWDLSTGVAERQKAQYQEEFEQAKVRQAARNQFLMQASTPDEVMQWHKANHADPFTGKMLADAGIDANQSMSAIASIRTPEQLNDFKAKALLGSDKFFEHMKNQAALGESARHNQAAERNAAGQLAEEIRWHDMQDRNREQTTSKGISPEDEQLLGVAVNEGRVPREWLNNPTITRSTIATLKADPKANLVQQELDRQAAQLSTKDRAKREAAYPKATQSYQAAMDSLNNTLADIDTMYNHPGLGRITGPVASRTANLAEDAVNAQTYHNNLVAASAINKISDMRANSPTGAALGNTSDADMRLIKEAATKLDQANSKEKYQQALLDYKRTVEEVKKRTEGQYHETYAYRGLTSPAASGGWGTATVVGGK